MFIKSQEFKMSTLFKPDKTEQRRKFNNIRFLFMIHDSRKSQGFTLIELIIYIAILSLIVGSFVSFAFSTASIRNKTYVIQEVHANARMAYTTIKQAIRKAESVNIVSSVFGSDPGALYLVMTASEENPTAIDLTSDDGRLRLTRSTSTPQIFMATSDEVKITNLVFTNLTGPNTRENIRVQFTIGYNTPDIASPDFIYSEDFQFTVGVRN